MHETTLRVGILGATGYTGRELVGLLPRHPGAEIRVATSESEAGRPLKSLHPSAPDVPLSPAEGADLERCDVVFSCLPHGESLLWCGRAREAGARVIDLSADLRVPSAETPAWGREAVYGLTELRREEIPAAAVVANPGCYPTAALLALAPLLSRGLVAGPVSIQAASGVTGAGRSLKRELLFAEIAEDFRAYAAGNRHRHLAEMRAEAGRIAGGAGPELVFSPHLLPVRRGILETILVPLIEPAPVDPLGPWREDYAGEPFVSVGSDPPSLRDVVGTNRVAISAFRVEGLETPHLQVFAALDNLLKGAAGQAVQNFNLMAGFPETEGLA
jgi:N-acetyl-gamma-glutamyl-phosphate reductase